MLQASFALNEGAGGLLDAATGKPIVLELQAGEKVYQDFTLEVTHPGGHSSRPVRPNAIDRLAAGLADRPDTEAAERLWSRNPAWNGMLRTTCVPTMSTGGTDGRFLNAAGIPTYGMSGILHDASGSRAHGPRLGCRKRTNSTIPAMAVESLAACRTNQHSIGWRWFASHGVPPKRCHPQSAVTSRRS